MRRLPIRLFSTRAPFKPLPSHALSPLFHDKDKSDKSSLIQASAEIDAVPGAASFLSDVYKTTGIGLATTLGTSQLLCYTDVVATHPMSCILGGGLCSMASIYGINAMKPEYHHKPENEAFRFSINSKERLGAYGTLCISTGTVISPLMYSIQGTTILPTALLLTSGVFGGCTLYALKSPLGAMSSWKAPLYGSIFGLLGVGIGSIITQYFGYTELSNLLFDINTYGGLVLFSGLTAYETQMAIKMYLNGVPDHLQVATQMHSNFINMLIRIIEILKPRR